IVSKQIGDRLRLFIPGDRKQLVVDHNRSTGIMAVDYCGALLRTSSCLPHVRWNLRAKPTHVSLLGFRLGSAQDQYEEAEEQGGSGSRLHGLPSSNCEFEAA